MVQTLDRLFGDSGPIRNAVSGWCGARAPVHSGSRTLLPNCVPPHFWNVRRRRWGAGTPIMSITRTGQRDATNSFASCGGIESDVVDGCHRGLRNLQITEHDQDTLQMTPTFPKPRLRSHLFEQPVSPPRLCAYRTCVWRQQRHSRQVIALTCSSRQL